MKRLRILVVTIALFALAGCSGDDAGSATTAAPAEPAAITIEGFSYTGATTASVGQTVVVTNEDTVGHTWTSVEGEFDSGSLAAGATFEYTFDEVGSYDYFCSVHPDMAGSITVIG